MGRNERLDTLTVVIILGILVLSLVSTIGSKQLCMISLDSAINGSNDNLLYKVGLFTILNNFTLTYSLSLGNGPSLVNIDLG